MATPANMPESDIQFLARVLRAQIGGDQVPRSDLDKLDAIVKYGHSGGVVGSRG